MADTGWLFPGSGLAENDVSGTNTAWGNPDRITADDGVVSSISLLGANNNTQLLVGYNFDFSAIPDGATIDQVEFRFAAQSNTGRTRNIFDRRIALRRAGPFSSTDNNTKISSDIWDRAAAGTYELRTYSPGDNWGESLTAGGGGDWDVKLSTFGAVVSGTGTSGSSSKPYVDYFQMKVHYTAAGGGFQPAWAKGANQIIGAGLIT